MKDTTIDSLIITLEGFDDLILLSSSHHVKEFGYAYASDVDGQVYRVYYTSNTPWSEQKPTQAIAWGIYPNEVYKARKSRTKTLYWHKLNNVQKGDILYQMHGNDMMRVTVEKHVDKKIYLSDGSIYRIDIPETEHKYRYLFNTEANAAHYEAYIQKRKEWGALIQQTKLELIEKIKEEPLTVDQIKAITNILNNY